MQKMMAGSWAIKRIYREGSRFVSKFNVDAV